MKYEGKMDKLDFIKIKSAYSVKASVKIIKIKTINWDKIFILC